MKINELKPCPFCGGEAKIIAEYESHYIECKDCGSQSTYCETDYAGKSLDKAVSVWNRRAPFICEISEFCSTQEIKSIVNCKNCTNLFIKDGVFGFCKRTLKAVEPDDYCSWGEKK